MKLTTRLVMMTVLLTGSLSITFAKSEPQNQSKAETEIRQRMAQWTDALKRNDVAMLDQILADDFQYILADGKTRNKSEEMAPNKAGDLKFETIAVDDVKVFVYGDTAIVTGVGSFKGTFKNRAFDSKERFCDVYQKRKGKWRVIASRPVELK